MRGRHPKPAHLRQNRTRKAGRATLDATGATVSITSIPNPDGRTWHALTSAWWTHVVESPMAAQFLPTDWDGLGRLALLVDAFYQTQSAGLLAEIRLGETRYGLSPLDRSRLSWELRRTNDTAAQAPRAAARPRASEDPRRFLMAIK